MANQEQLSILKQGVEVWNKWRSENHGINVDLSGANLSGINLQSADFIGAKPSGLLSLVATRIMDALNELDFGETNLTGADLTGVNLNGADLSGANLSQATLIGAYLIETGISRGFPFYETDFESADLSGAHLQGADLVGANFYKSNLQGADLTRTNLNLVNLRNACLSEAILREANLSNAFLVGADLRKAHLFEANLRMAHLANADLSKAFLGYANLRDADLSGANLTDADLSHATLVGTKVGKAKISGCSIYATNVWDLQGELEEQKDLVITRPFDPIVTVDNIEVAQFIYLILNNEKIRDAINTLTSKAVLVLGRFALPERKSILDALRNKLREHDLLPIVFDFDRPIDKDFTETIKTLAGLSYFVIADVTNPKSSPLELQATVPDYQIPFVPIIQEGENPFAMMVDLQKKYNWVLNTVSYDSEETLMKVLKPLIIDPAMKKRQELRIIKAQEPEIISAKDYLDKGKK